MSVLRIPYHFEGDGDREEPKIFVVIAHIEAHAFCIKATSNADFYRTPDQRLGCVAYAAGEISYFRKATFIQPENQHAIPHNYLKKVQSASRLQIFERLPGIEARLLAAIEHSQRMSPREKRRLNSLILPATHF